MTSSKQGHIALSAAGARSHHLSSPTSSLTFPLPAAPPLHDAYAACHLTVQHRTDGASRSYYS